LAEGRTGRKSTFEQFCAATTRDYLTKDSFAPQIFVGLLPDRRTLGNSAKLARPQLKAAIGGVPILNTTSHFVEENVEFQVTGGATLLLDTPGSASGQRAHRDTATVAQASKPAVPQVSQVAGLGRAGDLPTGKSATQQVWKPALRTSVGGQGVAVSRHARGQKPCRFALAHQAACCHRPSIIHMKAKTLFGIIGILALGMAPSWEVRAGEAVSLFDGKTLNGWEGNTNFWRVEDGAITAGWIERKQPHNDFLATTKEFGDFDLRVQYRLEGSNGFVNGGVQFRSQRVPHDFEVAGYQADLGAETDGNLYDESRRNRNLVAATKERREKALKPGQWNDYRIRAEGAHIQLWLNGVKTVDYTETDATMSRRGIIALQIHGGAYTRVQYRNLFIEERP
jgi:hypothetical protein